MPNFKKISKNISQAIIDNPRKDGAVSWININEAGKPEIEYLRKNFNFKLAHLLASSAKTASQRPVIIREDSYVFMILHFPVPPRRDDQNDGRVTSAEIEFFIGHGFLVTLPSRPVGPLEDFFNLCKKDSRSLLAFEFESSAILLYEIISKLLEYSYEILDENSLAISRAENVVLSSDQKKSDRLILNLRHNLINLRKIMQNHKNILKRLENMESSVIPPEYLKKYYGDLIERVKNIWETMENQREMVEIIYDSYQSLANQRLNNSMKMLTIFYVTFSSLALVAAIFSVKADGGMPLISQPNGFWLLTGLMGLTGLILLLIFKIKKWF